jgi:3-hydroxyisobutyrate dehydrogenase-like beta-hydroxyacid dehydrogenase
MTDLQVPLGFLGFGEAGFHLARGLRSAGAPPLVAFDIQADTGAAGAPIRERARETQTCLVGGPDALAAAAPVIFSVVTAASALEAARSLAPHLAAHHLYVDLNSVSPASKRQIGSAIGAGAGRFVEAAIMAPVPGLDHRVPILLNGSSASALAEALARYGMRFDVMHSEVGAAAAVKMCRSVVIKGLEALLLECTLVAGEYGATDRVFDSLSETYPGMDWRKTAHYMIGRVLQHGERRAREMEEVADTMRAAGIEPLMVEAAARRQDWEARLREAGRLRGARPETVEALLRILVDRSPAGESGA